MFIMTNSKFFEPHQIPMIRQRLLDVDDSNWSLIHSLPFQDPTIILIISLVAGPFGVDRFMIGDTALGVGKLLTCGGFGIWALVDWFLIMGATKTKNAETLMRALY